MKIKFNSDDGLPLYKSLKFCLMTITVRHIFEEDGKLYPQVFFRWYFVWVKHVKMIEYERIDISESIDINKTNKSKECMLCHYWYFLNKNFSYGRDHCDGCYNIMQ